MYDPVFEGRSLARARVWRRNVMNCYAAAAVCLPTTRYAMGFVKLAETKANRTKIKFLRYTTRVTNSSR